jgi:hypothetical protein
LAAGLTLHACEAHPLEIAAMTFLEFYVLFGLPLIAVGIGVGVYYFTAPKDRMHPGE